MNVLPAAGLVAAALALPAVAQADSIVYTNAADLETYVAHGDGTGARRITPGTGTTKWTYPSQADDGRVLVLRDGDALVLLDRQGRVLSTTTPLGGGFGVSGPYSPEVSPDGAKVVYDVYVQSHYETPDAVYLDSGWYSIFQELSSGKVLDYVKRYRQASWLADSQTVVAFDELAGLNAHVGTYVLGHDWNDVGQWLRTAEHPAGSGELTRAEDRTALVQAPTSDASSDTDGNTIGLYGGHGHEDVPDLLAEIHSVSGTKMRDASWSPDGTAIAWWEAGTGVYRTAFDGTQASIQPKLIISGAGQIDWGPADAGTGPAPTPSPSPTPSPTVTVTPVPVARPTVRLPKRIRPGRVLRFTVDAPARTLVKASVRDGHREIGRFGASVPAGRSTVAVALKRAAARRLGRRGHRRLAVAVHAGDVTVRGTVTVTARR